MSPEHLIIPKTKKYSEKKKKGGISKKGSHEPNCKSSQ